MKQLGKGSAVFKHINEDFIVEEINSDGRISSISSSVSAFDNTKVDLSGIDLNDRRDFLMCDVEKINIDNFSLINILCDKLGKRGHEIGYSGTKDKNAWTSQRISIFNPNIDKIREFSHQRIILKNFKWGKHKIKIGDLKGNRFTITLRDVDKDAVKILNRVRNTKHIPNFFGLQRFGSVRKDNFLIGKLILKGKYKDAVFAYLTGYGMEENNDVKNAKKRLKEEKNILQAGEYFPAELVTEHKIIKYLKENKDDYFNAIQILGEKILLIMCQSVQSQIFNQILEIGIDKGVVKENDTIIIPGYNSSNSEGKLKHIEKEILESHGFSLSDFRNKYLPDLSLTASKRKAYFEAKLDEIEILDDEAFDKAKKIVIRFGLDSGSYATTYLEYFFELR